MPIGLDNTRHLVVLRLKNRSLDHRPGLVMVVLVSVAIATGCAARIPEPAGRPSRRARTRARSLLLSRGRDGDHILRVDPKWILQSAGRNQTNYYGQAG